MAKYVNIPKYARGISYADEDYAETLARIFNNALDKDSILESIGSPWTPIDAGSIATSGNTLEFKNFQSTYILYMINIHGLLIDTTAGTGDLGIRTSTDGVTFDSGATDYANVKWGQDSATFDDDWVTGANAIYVLPNTQTRDNLRDDASTGEHATVLLEISNPVDPDTLTVVRYKTMVSDTSGNLSYTTGTGYRRSNEANLGIQLVTSANTFDAGFYDVYGLRRPAVN